MDETSCPIALIQEPPKNKIGDIALFNEYKVIAENQARAASDLAVVDLAIHVLADRCQLFDIEAVFFGELTIGSLRIRLAV